jgi:hypothetical protein
MVRGFPLASPQRFLDPFPDRQVRGQIIDACQINVIEFRAICIERNLEGFRATERNEPPIAVVTPVTVSPELAGSMGIC